jgi:hypothetical protein
MQRKVVILEAKGHQVPGRKQAPNPLIERTNNGGLQLLAFANAQPPLFASHLKR